MKKIFIVISFLLTLGFGSSCTNDISYVEEQTDNNGINYNTEFMELKMKMDELGYKRFGSYYSRVQTRASWWKKIYKFVISVATVDCVTGLAGTCLSGGNAVVGATVGVLGSVWAGFHQDRFVDPQFAPRRIGGPVNFNDSAYWLLRDSVLSNLVVPRPNGLPTTTLDSIGYIHNLVILNMHENHPELFSAENLYQNAFMDTVNVFVGRALALDPDSVSNELYSIPNLVSTCYSIRETMQTESSLEVAIDSLQSMFPEYTQEFDILNTFLESLDLETEVDNEHQYFTEVLALVEESNLPDNIKEGLRAGLLVAYASQKLWSSGIALPNHP